MRRANLYMRDPRRLSSEYRDDSSKNMVVFLVCLAVLGLLTCLFLKVMKGNCGSSNNRSGKISKVSSGKVHECSSLEECKTIMETSDTLVFVKFYASWCGHCKAMAPSFDEASQILGSEVVCIKIDCDKHMSESDMKNFGIQGFPMLCFFKKGKKIGEHAGPRDTKSLVQSAKQHT